jgi:hypothetical protein
MPRDAAVSFLRNDCAFDPPLDEIQAQALWEDYRGRVEALPERAPRLPEPIALTPPELEHARRFRGFLASQGIVEVQDVIKLDLAGLTVLQHYVVAERAHALAQSIHAPDDWLTEFLPLAPRGSSIRYAFRRTGAVSTCIDFDLPHAEFVFQPNPHAPGNFGLVECLHHASVGVAADRIFLHTGYHRCFARLTSTPPGETATALVAVVAGAAGPGPGPSAETRDRTSPYGDRAARFGDFVDDRLALEIALVQRRFQLQLSATVVAMNERRDKPRPPAPCA